MDDMALKVHWSGGDDQMTTVCDWIYGLNISIFPYYDRYQV